MIHTLPPELLLQVFDLAVHTSDNFSPPPEETVIFDNTTTTDTCFTLFKDLQYPDSHLRSGITAHETSNLSPLDLSHVCQDWRRIAFSTRELWSTMFITNGAPNTPSVLRLWLQNSGSASLKIVFRDTEVPHWNQGEGGTMADMVRIATLHSERWRSFKMRLRRIIMPMREVRTSLAQLIMPKLEGLSLGFSKLTAEDILDGMISSAPALNELQLWSTLDMNAPFLGRITRLTILTLSMVHFYRRSPILKALRQCNALRTLSISLESCRSSYSPPLQPPRAQADVVSLPSLHHLHLTACSDSGLGILVRNFHLPSLTTLSVHSRLVADTPSVDNVYHALDRMLTRSECKLRTLSITEELGRWFAERFRPFLSHPALVELEDLRIGGVVGEAFWLSLAVSPNETSPLPNLRSLRLDAVLLDYADSTMLVDMALARSQQAVSHNVSRLTSLRVGFQLRGHLELARKVWDRRFYPWRENRVERDFYYVGNTDKNRTLGKEHMYRDFSVVLGRIHDWN